MAFIYDHVKEMKVPFIFDKNASRDNPIGFEYILMEHVDGVMVEKIYASLSSKQQFSIVSQLQSMIHPLKNIEFRCYHYKTKEYHKNGLLGGFLGASFGDDGVLEVLVGPDPDHEIEPTSSRFARWHALMEKSLHVKVDGLPEDLKDCIKTFQQWLSTNESHPMNTKNYFLTLSHQDIVPKNVLVDPDTLQITAILDFEFASVCTCEVDFNEIFGEEW
eukprot:CAMPEP_0117420810 /NCGR_PEP_ID=MMETSP0758-20121206/2071_1 /TAXON_ID=63605 /ORGANISM="Percolomonas cosmopolitus, Strain AE-1 (ATCC 50343)" /LENGTH=217 /DNA_ID=CAMNT_0005202645 /DNA_START=632 /DNA_END=1282 /DNA_ORIENTATION=+